jgi:macrodomain Ter protein organizer (MatP/YcbG family)
MPDLLVRDIDPELYERMKKAAKAQRKSLAQAAREALADKFAPRKEDAWAAVDRIRAKIGKVSSDSTRLIREDRDNDEPYR